LVKCPKRMMVGEAVVNLFGKVGPLQHYLVETLPILAFP
jgi:hypothetical protein